MGKDASSDSGRNYYEGVAGRKHFRSPVFGPPERIGSRKRSNFSGALRYHSLEISAEIVFDEQTVKIASQLIFTFEEVRIQSGDQNSSRQIELENFGNVARGDGFYP